MFGFIGTLLCCIMLVQYFQESANAQENKHPYDPYDYDDYDYEDPCDSWIDGFDDDYYFPALDVMSSYDSGQGDEWMEEQEYPDDPYDY